MLKKKGDYARDKGAYAFAQGEYANAKGLYAEEKGDYANAQGNFANTKGQYANAQGLYAKEKGDDALIAKGLTEQATVDTRNIAIFAGDKADEANQAAILANNKAGLADTATIAANNAAILANQKAGVSQIQASYRMPTMQLIQRMKKQGLPIKQPLMRITPLIMQLLHLL